MQRAHSITSPLVFLRDVVIKMKNQEATCRRFSTKTRDSLPKLSKDYLATWLGSEISGASYHERIVNASKISKPIPKNSPQAPEMVPTAATLSQSDFPTVQHQHISVPVISIKWGISSIDDIQSEIKHSLQNIDVDSSCFVDMSLEGDMLSVDNWKSTLSTVIEAVKLSERKINILAAVNCVDDKSRSVAAACGLQIISKCESTRISTPQSSLNEVHSAALQPSIAQSELSSSTPPTSARIHYGAVRSGQQIYADGCSLVIIGSVNNGAEVMADGDIHIYGTLKGRAVAGLGGSANAHIFARAFDASLICIYDSFVAIDACAELKRLQGKEVSIRLLQKGESSAELRASGAEVVDCGHGNSLVVSPLAALVR